jgi:hypothetical protein
MFMAIDLTVTVDALRWIVGDTPAVAALADVEAYVTAVEKERDEAKVAEAAARAALEKAQADAAALSEKLNIIFEDLKDGVLDNPEVVA